MVIETKRLALIPLSARQIEAAMISKARMAREMGLCSSVDDLGDVMRRIYGIKLRKMKEAPSDWLFCTYWQIVLRETSEIAGEVGFKGMRGGGEIEVGYGLEPEYRGFGYMTEAGEAILQWALAQEGVTAVIAETVPDNIASQRVLERLRMREYRRDEKGIGYRMEAANDSD